MKAQVTICRSSREEIHIEIMERESRIQFVDLRMTCDAFAKAITGLGAQEATLEVRGLEHVGKKRVREGREIVCPLDTYDKGVLGAWLRENAKEDGWEIDDYLSSQKSITRVEGKTLLRYSVEKFIDPPQEEEAK